MPADGAPGADGIGRDAEHRPAGFLNSPTIDKKTGWTIGL